MENIDPKDIQELIDRTRIYDVLTRYCRALDRCDVDLMRSVYWDDARDDHGVFNGGAQEFAEFISGPFSNHRHGDRVTSNDRGFQLLLFRECSHFPPSLLNKFSSIYNFDKVSK